MGPAGDLSNRIPGGVSLYNDHLFEIGGSLHKVDGGKEDGGRFGQYTILRRLDFLLLHPRY